MAPSTAVAILGLRGHGNGKSSLGGMAITLQSGQNSRARDFSAQSAQVVGCWVMVRRTPLRACGTASVGPRFTFLLRLVRWPLPANRHLVSGKHAGCDVTQ